MHLAHTDMLLNQKDNQLLEWTRNNRTEEMVAIIRKRKEE